MIPLKEFDRTDVKNDEMIGVDENDNKTEPKDATHDKVDDFNEDTCDLCIYDFWLRQQAGSPISHFEFIIISYQLFVTNF